MFTDFFAGEEAVNESATDGTLDAVKADDCAEVGTVAENVSEVNSLWE